MRKADLIDEIAVLLKQCDTDTVEAVYLAIRNILSKRQQGGTSSQKKSRVLF